MLKICLSLLYLLCTDALPTLPTCCDCQRRPGATLRAPTLLSPTAIISGNVSAAVSGHGRSNQSRAGSQDLRSGGPAAVVVRTEPQQGAERGARVMRAPEAAAAAVDVRQVAVRPLCRGGSGSGQGGSGHTGSGSSSRLEAEGVREVVTVLSHTGLLSVTGPLTACSPGRCLCHCGSPRSQPSAV